MSTTQGDALTNAQVGVMNNAQLTALQTLIG
jgi:hypothetical protein